MASDMAEKRKVPLWVWIVGGFLILGMFGNLLGGEEADINAEDIEAAQVEAVSPEVEVVEEQEPTEAEVVEEQPQPTEAEVIEEEAVPEEESQSAPAPEPVNSPETSAEATDPRFSSCTKAIEAGFGPYTQGVDVEYGWYQDRDKDGIVCER